MKKIIFGLMALMFLMNVNASILVPFKPGAANISVIINNNLNISASDNWIYIINSSIIGWNQSRGDNWYVLASSLNASIDARSPALNMTLINQTIDARASPINFTVVNTTIDQRTANIRANISALQANDSKQWTNLSNLNGLVSRTTTTKYCNDNDAVYWTNGTDIKCTSITIVGPNTLCDSGFYVTGVQYATVTCDTLPETGTTGTTLSFNPLYVDSLYSNGKITSLGGYDPPYVEYSKQNIFDLEDRITQEIPDTEIGGLITYWDGSRLYGAKINDNDTLTIYEIGLTRLYDRDTISSLNVTTKSRFILDPKTGEAKRIYYTEYSQYKIKDGYKMDPETGDFLQQINKTWISANREDAITKT